MEWEEHGTSLEAKLIVTENEIELEMARDNMKSKTEIKSNDSYFK